MRGTADYGPDSKRARTALMLTLCAVVSVLVGSGSIWVQLDRAGVEARSGKVLPDFAADMPQVRIITITTKDGAYNFVRKGGVWVMPERNDFPISAAALSGLAKSLSDITFKAQRTSDPSQFARLSVDDPNPDSDGALISIKGSTGQLLHSLYVGQKAEAIFVRKAGSNDVFEVSGDMPIMSSPAAWLEMSVVEITPETIASVSGQRVGEAGYDIVRRPDGGFAPVGGRANVTATAAAIALTKWAPLDVKAASTLSSNPVGSHATTLRDGTIINVAAYQERDGDWVVLSGNTVSGEPNAATNTLNLRTDGWAFRLTSDSFSDLTFTKRAIVDGPAAAKLP